MSRLFATGLLLLAMSCATTANEPLLPGHARASVTAQELSELEKLRIENLQLKVRLSVALQRVAELEAVQNTLAVQVELAQLIADIEKAYPGKTLKDGKLVEK
jgi:hypothetical protein